MNRSPLLLAILAALSGCEEEPRDGTACLPLSETESESMCPAPEHFDESRLIIQDEPADSRCGGYKIVEVTGEGKPQRESWMAPQCCYPVKILFHERDSCVSDGRPYYDAGRAVVAPLHMSAVGAAPSSERAAAWARAGAAEHASVAAFARLSLELMSLGAPNELLRDVHQAALDEVRHADECWALAERYGASRVRAAGLPIRDVTLASSLAALAASAVREGCLAETLGAQVMASLAELVPDPQLRSTMTSIAREEATHAVLSFRIVAWALRVGGADVRAAVRGALAEPWPKLDTQELALRTDVSPAIVAEAANRALTDVLTPAAARLLAA
jgi:hypothetical protein